RFSVGPDAYAVRIELVREILEVGQMTPLPLMPTFVRGVMNLRGAVVPVVDLAARLGMDPTAIGRRTCVIMVGIAGSQGAQ
ncbi:chemotaxis protein CheW, partial [Staphylococcus aureus]|uniref:chemotaxis protein CheW n=1 Tax=Staphylococcus aureus TaxID=1280 RepID=UPI001E2F3CB7